MSLADRIGEHVREEGRGIVADMAFAVVWVTVASLLVEALDGPRWVLYMFLLAGIPAYFGFVLSLSMARRQAGLDED